jgi:hypothetical protein
MEEAENKSKPEMPLVQGEKPKVDLSNPDHSMIPEEFLEALPEKERGKVVSFIKQSMFSSEMRRNNPIADKITTEHIT